MEEEVVEEVEQVKLELYGINWKWWALIALGCLVLIVWLFLLLKCVCRCLCGPKGICRCLCCKVDRSSVSSSENESMQVEF